MRKNLNSWDSVDAWVMGHKFSGNKLDVQYQPGDLVVAIREMSKDDYMHCRCLRHIAYLLPHERLPECEPGPKCAYCRFQNVTHGRVIDTLYDIDMIPTTFKICNDPAQTISLQEYSQLKQGWWILPNFNHSSILKNFNTKNLGRIHTAIEQVVRCLHRTHQQTNVLVYGDKTTDEHVEEIYGRRYNILNKRYIPKVKYKGEPLIKIIKNPVEHVMINPLFCRNVGRFDACWSEKMIFGKDED